MGIFYRCLSVFPLAIGAMLGMAFVLGFSDWEHYFAPTYAMRSIALIIIVILFVTGLFSMSLFRDAMHLGRRQRLQLVIIVSVVAMALRLLYLYLVGFDVSPYSDYLWAYETALGSEEYYFRYALFPTWGFYARAIGVALALFGHHYQVIQIINVFLSGLTAIALAGLAYIAARSNRVMIATEVIYAISPTSIAYVQMLSPEIPAIFLDCVALLLIAGVFSLPTGRAWPVLLSAAGIVLGLAELLKPVSPIAIIAFFTAFCMFARRRSNLDEDGACLKLLNLRSVLVTVVSVALMLVCYGGVKSALTSYLEESFDEPINTTAVPHFLFVGLQPDGEGQVHLGACNHWDMHVYEAHGYDFGAANREVLEKVRDDFVNNPGALLGLFAQKVKWAWQADSSVFRTAQTQAGYTRLLGLLASSAQWFYIVAIAFATVGSWRCASKRYGAGPALLFVGLVIFGFALLLLIGEAQSRYKIMIMPYIYLYSAIGLDWASTTITPIAMRLFPGRRKQLHNH